VLELVDVDHVLDLGVVLGLVADVARVVALDGVDEGAVLPDHAQLDDVARELVPLERAIIVDVDLAEELYQIPDQPNLVSGLRQVDQHDLDELFHGQPALLALHEVLLYFLELAVVEVAHDVVVVVLLVEVAVLVLLQDHLGLLV